MEVLLPLLSATNPPELPKPLVVSIVVATVVFVVLARRRTVRSSQASPDARRAALGIETRAQARIESDLRETVIELENLARRINGEIETKYRKLEAVIRDADARIAELSRLSRTSESLERDPHSAPDNRIGTRDSKRTDRQAVYALADAGHDAAEIARRLERPEGEIEMLLALRGELSKPGPIR